MNKDKFMTIWCGFFGGYELGMLLVNVKEGNLMFAGLHGGFMIAQLVIGIYFGKKAFND
jgi:hypothetical protein